MALNLKSIKGITFDIDGVMTDGGILCIPGGDLLRTYNAKDCFAVRVAVMNGYDVGVITGGRSETIRERMNGSTGVPNENIYLGSKDKRKQFRDFCEKHGLQPSEVMYFGDDVPDVAVMKACGISIAPADACIEAKEAADYVSPYPGGKGCVRHGIEMVLRSQGKWTFDAEQYEKTF